MPVFLFTQIEKFTEMWDKQHKGMSDALTLHDTLIGEIIRAHKGQIVKHTGQGYFATFKDSTSALTFAVELQMKISAQNWGEVGDLRVRIGIHAGEAEKRGDDYFGPVINRTARLMQAAWGGQILITEEVKKQSQLPEGVVLRDLGKHVFSDLAESLQIYELSHHDFIIKAFPPINTLSVHMHNLPVQITPFVGRKDDITAMRKMLTDQSRILTIIGLGGMGKTRLALQVAADMVNAFKHGVYFVPLAPLLSASIQILVIAIADALHVTFYGKEDPKQQLLDYLREKEILLVMDNFEHLIEEAVVLSAIIDKCPRVKILVTSWQRLQIKGEWIHELKGMNIQSEHTDIQGSAAVELFVQSAQRINPDFILDESNKGAVINICRLVDGLPLAIELAASWVRSLSCYEILKEIGKSLDFLGTHTENIPERHRSLRAVFDYSWELLSTRAKRMFAGLSIFNGSFVREAAQEIAKVSLSDLSAFVDKTLLRRNANGRYEILPLLRHYAAEKFKKDLQEKEQMQAAFCKFYAKMFSQRFGPGQIESEGGLIDTMRPEIGNIRAAWLWAVEASMWDEIGRLLKNLFTYYERRSYYQEGKTLFELAIMKLDAIPGSDERGMLLIQLKGRLGAYEQLLGNYDRSEELLRQCLAMSEKFPLHEDAVYAQVQLGHLLYRQGKFDEAIKNAEILLKHEHEIKNRSLVSSIKNTLGNVYFRQDENEKALNYYKDCESISISNDDLYKLTNALNSIGNVYLRTERYDEAQEYYQRSLKLAKQINNKKMMGIILNNLGNRARNQGKFDEAYRYIEESLVVKRDVGEPVSIGFTISVLGFTAYDQKEFERGLRYFHKALELLVPRKAMYYILNIFPSCGEMLLIKRQYEWAARIMLFARDHPQVTDTIKKIMIDDLAELQKKAPEIDIKRVEKDLKKRGEDQFFSELLNYLSAM